MRPVSAARLASGDVITRPAAPARSPVSSAANTASAAATSAASSSMAAYSRLPPSPAPVRFRVITTRRAWSTINVLACVKENRGVDQRTTAPAAVSSAYAAWFASSFR